VTDARRSDDYGEVPYPGLALRQTHPDRLVTVATLLGVAAPDPLRCRVLEIGCSDAGNLMGMAACAPGSTFTGLDLDARAVGLARERVERWRVRNVEVVVGDLREWRTEPASYDVVIAHGVHSWVGLDAAADLMASVRHHLAPHGIAYVSYNTLPGSHLRSMVGQAVRRLVADVALPERADAARSWLDLVVAGTDDSSHAEIFRQVAAETRAKPDQLLLHDDLSAVNDPVFFADFVAAAAEIGLAYLGEGSVSPSVPSWASTDLQARMSGLDEVGRQQLLDIVSNRSFRQTLLVREEDAPPDHTVDPARIEGLWAAAPVRTADSVGHGTTLRLLDGVTATTDDLPLIQALRTVGAAWPASVAVADLACSRAALLALYESRALELRVTPALAVRPGDRPTVTGLARHQAADGVPIAALRHDSLSTQDAAVLATVALCDGTRTRAQIAAELEAAGDVGASADVGADLDRLVDRLTDLSLFLA
jgi:SAM-dependent methyltransferase